MVEDTPFSNLPSALVEEMLSKSEAIGLTLFTSLSEIHKNKETFRKSLEDDQLLDKFKDDSTEVLTSCGIDGSYAIERLLGTDLITCAAIGIEGLVPPHETKLWDIPNHDVLIESEVHNPDNSTLLRGLMVEMEIILASKAPHDLILLDGSFTSPLIQINQAVNKIINEQKISSKILLNKFENFISSYLNILTSEDRIWISLPKYTSRRELGNTFSWPHQYDDRAVLTSILDEGEYTRPISLQRPNEPWHLKIPNIHNSNRIRDAVESIIDSLNNLYVFYFKPNNGLPALRVEITKATMDNMSKLSSILTSLQYQTSIPSIYEPYPLYIADRMVKHIPAAIPAFRQTATQKMVELKDGDISDILFNMHSYRTEGGS